MWLNTIKVAEISWGANWEPWLNLGGFHKWRPALLEGEQGPRPWSCQLPCVCSTPLLLQSQFCQFSINAAACTRCPPWPPSGAEPKRLREP